MRKISAIKLEPNEAFSVFESGLCRALKIDPAQIRTRIEQDNAHREAMRVESGKQKRGPKSAG